MKFVKIADMPKYHNFWRPVNFADMLEVSKLSKGYHSYRFIAAIQTNAFDYFLGVVTKIYASQP
jgi:hypothetical protein